MSTHRPNSTSPEVAKLQKRLRRSQTALKCLECLSVTIMLVSIIGAIFWGTPMLLTRIFSLTPPFGNGFLLVPIAFAAIIFCGVIGAVAGVVANFVLHVVLTDVIASWQRETEELPREISRLRGFGPSTAPDQPETTQE